MWSPIPMRMRGWIYSVGMAFGLVAVVYGIIDEVGYAALGTLLAAICGLAVGNLSDDEPGDGERFLPDDVA